MQSCHVVPGLSSAVCAPPVCMLVGEYRHVRAELPAGHLSACFLDVEDGERIVFTNALVGGWRPAEQPFMTAIITLQDHPLGTEYVAHVMHKNNADRNMHEEMGFYDGWGTSLGNSPSSSRHRHGSQEVTLRSLPPRRSSTWQQGR